MPEYLITVTKTTNMAVSCKNMLLAQVLAKKLLESPDFGNDIAWSMAYEVDNLIVRSPVFNSPEEAEAWGKSDRNNPDNNI